MKESRVAKCKIIQLEKFMPKVREGYYANVEEPEFDAKERQDINLAKGILKDKRLTANF